MSGYLGGAETLVSHRRRSRDWRPPAAGGVAIQQVPRVESPSGSAGATDQQPAQVGRRTLVMRTMLPAWANACGVPGWGGRRCGPESREACCLWSRCRSDLTAFFSPSLAANCTFPTCTRIRATTRTRQACNPDAYETTICTLVAFRRRS